MEQKTNQTTKEKVLVATLDLISNIGLQNVTIRQIAAAAGVNVAAVNYHFGSKDKVINDSLEFLMNRSNRIFNCLKDTKVAPEVRLRLFIKNYSKNLIKYPEIIKLMIYQSMNESSPTNTFQDYLKSEGVNLIKNTFHEINSDDNDVSLNIRTMLLISSLCFPVVLENHIDELFSINLNNPEIIKDYIEMISKQSICSATGK